ncbi:MAG: hypothetical protein J5966_02285 [Lachnospiraceae bacterium]|nr:hypothetical protein [Lachnospiraceae bacterium]
MMEISERTCTNYVYHVCGHDLELDKKMVDRYSELVCPVDEEYLTIMIDTFTKDGCKDGVLSCKIALDMSLELSGYERSVIYG